MLARTVSTDMLLARATGYAPLRIALWVAQAGLVPAFECLGILKSCMPVAKLQGELHLFTDVPHSILPLVGGIETAGASLLLLPSTLRIFPALTPLAACGLSASALLGAIIPGTGAAFALPLPNLVFAGLAAFVAWRREYNEERPHSSIGKPHPGRVCTHGEGCRGADGREILNLILVQKNGAAQHLKQTEDSHYKWPSGGGAGQGRLIGVAT